jgi:hypothetical protein
MPHVHPLGKLELPSVVDALVEVLRTALKDGPRGVRRASQLLEPLPDADGVLGHLAFGAEASHGTELGYERVPFEVVPLFWNGGDGLHYGFAWYDGELGPDHPPAVSYAPVDERPCWLGDDPTEGIRNLLAWYTHRAFEGDELAAEMREKGLALGARLGWDVSEPPAELRRGARSGRPVEPAVPLGWRFEPGYDGVGTLAPRACFAPWEPADHGWEVDDWMRDGERALREGFAGTALAAFREAYRRGWEDHLRGAEAMGRAYEALGRSPLVARVQRYLELNGG